MCFFSELNKNIEEFIDKQSIKDYDIINDIYNAESDINEIYYSNEKIFDEELELIFNKYFSAEIMNEKIENLFKELLENKINFK